MNFALVCYFSIVSAQNTVNLSKGHLGFLQLSNDGSGNDSGGMEDDSKVLTVFLLNVIGCIIACAAIQGVIILSKRMNNELINLRKNYKTYTEFKKFNDLKRNYSIEKEALEKTQADN